jgi:outer membrane protein W
MRRLLSIAGGLALTGVLAAPTTSYAQQSVNFLIGGFVPRNEAARDRNDVLRRNLNAGDDSLLFNISDFNHATVGFEWLFPLGEVFEGGLGVGLYSRTVPSVYAFLENSNGSEIEQDLSLRMVPFTATVRWLPIGRRDAFTPYIGGGVHITRFRYRESGQFVDVNDDIFEDTFTATGAATGPVILGGARFPVGSAAELGGEVRYQRGIGDVSAEDDFLGTEIDLGGFSYLFTINVKF